MAGEKATGKGESAAYLRLMLDTTNQAFYVVDPEGFTTLCNAAFLRLLGFQREADVLGRRLHDLIHHSYPDGTPYPAQECPIYRCARTGESAHVNDEVLFRVDGTSFAAEYWVHPIRYGGALRGALCTFIDITERRRAEEALRKTEIQLQAIVNGAPLGVYLVDGDFRIRVVNDRAFAASGNIPDLIGRDLDEVNRAIWSQAYADEIIERHRHTLETGESYRTSERIEYRRDRGVLEYYQWQISRAPLADGGYGVICYFRDISAQVFARRAIAASEERLRFMAEAMPQKIFTATPDGEVDYFNQQWTEFTGLPMTQIEKWGWVQFIHPDDLLQTVEVWKHSIETGEPIQLMHRFRRADGAYRWHLSRVHAMRDAQGKITMWIGSNTDIHEQKEIEEAYRELSETLECKIEERTRDLQIEILERQKVEATLQQAQKMETIGQLTGGVAHDFNNVLAAVIGNLELVLGRVTDPTARRLLQNAQHAAERGAKLTDHLLSFARKQVLRVEPSDLNGLLASFEDLLVRTIGPAVDITLTLAEDLWPAMVDPSQFQMAILNLAVNARDAMPEGGSFSIATRNIPAGSPDLPKDLSRGDYACVSVQDTGTGMTAEVAVKAFEPFYTTKEIGKGTGLGLSQVYGFSKQLGGTAMVTSQLGTGTGVFLFLPRAGKVAAMASPPQGLHAEPVPPAPSNGVRVLVVDDDPEVLKVVAHALRTLGFDAVTADSGRRGLEMLATGMPVGLAVVDFAMPGMNGIEFIRRLRVSRPNLPCMMITGYADVSKFGDPASGGTLVLRKPYRLKELAAMIDQLLAQLDRQRGPAEVRRPTADIL
jgi:PAS domain S-box-containing protein